MSILVMLLVSTRSLQDSCLFPGLYLVIPYLLCPHSISNFCQPPFVLDHKVTEGSSEEEILGKSQ